MSASGKTPNFDFPLYEVQDNFAPLTSFNLLSNKADQQLALVKSSADTAEALSSANEQDIQAIQTWQEGINQELLALVPHNITFNAPPTGVSNSWNNATILAGMLFFEINAVLKPSEMVNFPISNNFKLYVISTTSEKFLKIPTGADAHLYLAPISNRYSSDGAIKTFTNNVVAFHDNNITYFAVPWANNSVEVVNNLTTQIWGTGFRVIK